MFPWRLRVSHWEARGELGPKSHSGGFPDGALLTGTCSIFSCRRDIGLEEVLVSFSLRKLTRPANGLIENETGRCSPRVGRLSEEGQQGNSTVFLHLTF